MDNALWLFFALPQWYFQTLLMPFSAGPLTAIPASGIVSLLPGLAIAAAKREGRVLWFFVGMLLSHALVVTAGFLRGRLEHPDAFLLLFLAVQLTLTVLVIYQSERSRLAAVFLAWFNATYALFAAFIAGMSFSNTWL
jgi:hypothetical protein